MIFKLQRPLSSNMKYPPCLVYNEDRSIVFEMPMHRELEILFRDEFKIYIDSPIKKLDGVPLLETLSKLFIGEIVEDQDW